MIRFTGGDLPKAIITLAKAQVTPIDTRYIQGANPAIQELLVVSDLSHPICSSLSEPGNPIDAVFANYDASYWVHDPRYVSYYIFMLGSLTSMALIAFILPQELLENTLQSPLPDGGGGHAGAAVCV